MIGCRHAPQPREVVGACEGDHVLASGEEGAERADSRRDHLGRRLVDAALVCVAAPTRQEASSHGSLAGREGGVGHIGAYRARSCEATSPTVARRVAWRQRCSAPPTGTRGRAPRVAAGSAPTTETKGATRRCRHRGAGGRRRAAARGPWSARAERRGRGRSGASAPCARARLATRGSPVDRMGPSVVGWAWGAQGAAKGRAQRSRQPRSSPRARSWCRWAALRRRTALSPTHPLRAPPPAAVRAAGASSAGVPRAARQAPLGPLWCGGRAACPAASSVRPSPTACTRRGWRRWLQTSRSSACRPSPRPAGSSPPYRARRWLRAALRPPPHRPWARRTACRWRRACRAGRRCRRRCPAPRRSWGRRRTLRAGKERLHCSRGGGCTCPAERRVDPIR